MENFSNNSQITDLQSLLNFVNQLKNDGRIWNEADFCQKCGFPRSYLSDLKAGRKVLSEQLIRKIRTAFPDFGGAASVPLNADEPTLGQVYQAVIDHDTRFHATVDRILDAMGVPDKKSV